MNVMILGALLFFIIGGILSLIGSGGAILTIPILVYIYKIDPYWATSYSMFIMGISNWAATIDNIKKRYVLYKTGLLFAIPALIVTFFIRKLVLPILPEVFLENRLMTITKGNAIMIVFSFLILFAAIRTLKNKQVESITFDPNHSLKNILQGAGVGIVTGFVGAGGGFLIVPALILTSNIQMRYAIATSLFIISITTSLGFLGDLNSTIEWDWKFLLYCTFFSVIGVVVTNTIKERFSINSLKLFFGYFILALGVLVFFMEMAKMEVFCFF